MALPKKNAEQRGKIARLGWQHKDFKRKALSIRAFGYGLKNMAYVMINIFDVHPFCWGWGFGADMMTSVAMSVYDASRG